MPDCLAPRRHPNPHRPQSPQSTPLRRVSAASSPSAAAPRRISCSFGGTFGGSRTPSSRSIAATSASTTGPSIPSTP